MFFQHFCSSLTPRFYIPMDSISVRLCCLLILLYTNINVSSYHVRADVVTGFFNSSPTVRTPAPAASAYNHQASELIPPEPSQTDCESIICTRPLTNTPVGSPCGCVYPMHVKIRISIPLYALLLQVSELAKGISSGVFLRQSQLRITAAESESQQPLKTVVSIELVPLESKFDTTTAYFIRRRFLRKMIHLNNSVFGDYEVLYVTYPGLSWSSRTVPSIISERDNGPYFGIDNKTLLGKPFGVDVHGKHTNIRKLGRGLIAIISLSAFALLVLCISLACVSLIRCTVTRTVSENRPQIKLPSHLRPSGTDEFMDGSNTSSRSLSAKSSVTGYTGSAKTFSLAEIENATCNFDVKRLIGEGGFGLVYKGVLEDGTYVAVKVLKTNHQHGEHEFMSEVDMLCRLHHRNLVKLVGVCVEGRKRCLVYELVPNGSLESHLHGSGKPPLDWSSRMKIALGAARGLAYLHEDSNPRVIHRDFKSSNILLENDFTPKVSDFGLAQSTLASDNSHISSDVIGTFGYIAPEYAMTGNYLVKSDVYSYGVVLLELLTNRKPIDMSQPPGHQSIVDLAHPHLNSEKGLKLVTDPSITSNITFDIIGKVAAIASLCVQPDVTNRPYMGEVVQALKLVVDETEEVVMSGSCSHDVMSGSSGNCPFNSQPQIRAYNSDTDIERGHLVSELRSFRRHASSGPIRMGKGKELWSMVRRLYGGSMSEHELWRRSR